MIQFVAWRLRFLLAKFAELRPIKRNRGRILCFVTGGIGDKLMALPAIRQLRQEFPGAKMTLAVNGLVPPFFECEAERVISVKQSSPSSLIRLAREGFDMCFVNSLGAFDVGFEIASFFTGARDLRGPRLPSVSKSKVVYTKSYVFGEGHETLNNLVGAGGSSTEDRVAYPLVIPDNAEPSLKKIPDVIFHPGSSAFGLTNRWSAESYAAVARELSAAGYSIMAVGTPDEAPLLDELKSLAGSALDCEAGLSLIDLTLVLRRTKLVIANDSGIGHLAAAAGAPLITIMGANKSERVAPVGEKVTIIGPRCEYGGCYNNPDVPECKYCINRITPDEVLAAAMEKLRSA